MSKNLVGMFKKEEGDNFIESLSKAMQSEKVKSDMREITEKHKALEKINADDLIHDLFKYALSVFEDVIIDVISNVEDKIKQKEYMSVKNILLEYYAGLVNVNSFYIKHMEE